MPIIMVTGGARSGKSTYAEKLCRNKNENVVYIACAKVTDDEMAERIKKHQQSRPSAWQTLEQYKNFAGLTDKTEGDVYLLECVTTMVTNLMFDENVDFEKCTEHEINQIEQKILEEVKSLIAEFAETHKTLVIVTNEVGMGLVPAYRLGRIFRDIAGRINRYIAECADEVYCIISGLPMKLK